MLALFDRLTHAEPPDLIRSIEDEIRRIATTRVYADTDSERTILNFGVASVVEFAYGALGGHAELGRRIKNAVEAYEPRVKNVRVEWTNLPGLEPHLYMAVSADLAVGETPERLRLVIDVS